MKRHFTVTAFVSVQGQTLLHWHAKNRMWLPPGGHIELDEDPVQAAHREALEEAGFPVEILPTASAFSYEMPPQLTAPVTIMIEDILYTPSEPAHQHIDLIYFTVPASRGLETPPPGTWRWVSLEALRQGRGIALEAGTPPIPVAEDVRVLAIAAIERAEVAEKMYHEPIPKSVR
ncbi:MAG: NUDIX domain-containing protein [Chloroflexi bacterium]|nr:NUDIX domain-containing protein [Chloroflexota bacterium]